MSDSELPKVGEWYINTGSDRFEVVAIDDDEGTIEIQYYDGTIEELELDAWNEMEITASEAPEDWAGSYDIEREDYGVDLETSARTSRNPLEDLDK